MRFPTTNWRQLAEATMSGDPEGQAALAAFCEGYRGPVRAFLCRTGYSPDEAEDLTQEFFLRWLKSESWKRADRMRGRFRSFLLGALRHLLAHESARKLTAKRGSGAEEIRLDDEEVHLELPAPTDPAVYAFDRAWALALVMRTLAELRAEAVARGKEAEFEVLRGFLPGSEMPPALDAAAGQLGVNLAACKSALHRLRERFRVLLRTEVARTVSAPHDVEDELRYLRSLLVGANPGG